MKITSQAKKVFIDYIKNHIVAQQHEIKCDKITNIRNNIDTYFEVELQEKEHKDVVEMIKRNNNIMSVAIMRHWISENYNEIYVKKKLTCD